MRRASWAHEARSIFRHIILTASLALTTNAAAQIPYFAGTVGDGKLYGYSSLKVRPGINRLETYTTFQYGIGQHFATGMDLYTGKDCAYWGALVRYGLTSNKWFSIGAEVTPSFNLNNSFKFSYLTSALYLNGQITQDGRLFWCSNTWWIVRDGERNGYSNYEYLGYTIPLKHGRSITPMAGAIHSWKFDQPLDLAAGFYYTFKSWNLYLWGNDLVTRHPRLVLGLDFAL
jgi:hypothetical protein